MNQILHMNRIGWILIAVGLLFLLSFVLPGPSKIPQMEISQVIQMAETGQIAKIEVRGDKLNVTTTSGQTYSSRKESSVSVLELLKERGVPTGDQGVQIEVKKEDRGFFGTLLSFLPMIIFSVLLFYMFSAFRRDSGNANQMMGIGKTQARVARENKPLVTFDDVAGADEAKQDLAEIVEFLRNPYKFAKLGAKIPRGVLLAGPPGTGKTLFAKAVAGEANVSFFSISGSEFVQVFVGVGASRVRDLFKQDRENAPAIVFIDEIDAVGRHRGAGIGGGNDEREQTLNQILSEMVTEYGMSAELGPRTFNTDQEMVFLGKELAQGHDYSDAVAEKIDREIGKLLDKAQLSAKGIIETNQAKLALIAERLLVEETIEGPELRELIAEAPKVAPLAA